MKSRLPAARWVAAAPVAVVPTLFMPPQVLAWEAVLIVAAGLYALRSRLAPGPAYAKPVWWCRLKLAWWTWRAERRPLR